MGLDVLNAAGVEPDDSELVVQRADEINRLHGEIMGALRTSVEAAIRIGELLTEQKAELEHGEWLPWILTHVPFSEWTARNYMRLHRERAQLKSGNVPDLTSAYRAIGVLAEPAEPEPEGEPKPKREVLEPEVLPREEAGSRGGGADTAPPERDLAGRPERPAPRVDLTIDAEVFTNLQAAMDAIADGIAQLRGALGGKHVPACLGERFTSLLQALRQLR